ncbi:MAG: bis(5'-nucleosyl)-tetraphosphatase (symmetrical) YqeK [Bacillota bacterium]|nr:bis(5'-nucleosyl)-tetraphosphatase (symmetrical) YqeK [Bacillota bacterium]
MNKYLDAERLREHLRLTLKEKRYRHSLSVAELAVRLAEHWQLDVEKAYAAALAHDMARAYDDGELLRMAEQRGLPIDAIQRENPLLLHGPLAAALLREQWGVDDAELLAAVASHTVPQPAMSGVARIVYLADITEPLRPKWEQLKKLRELVFVDLDRAMLAAIADTERYAAARGQTVHPDTLAAKAYYQQQLNEKGGSICSNNSR